MFLEFQALATAWVDMLKLRKMLNLAATKTFRVTVLLACRRPAKVMLAKKQAWEQRKTVTQPTRLWKRRAICSAGPINLVMSDRGDETLRSTLEAVRSVALSMIAI